MKVIFFHYKIEGYRLHVTLGYYPETYPGCISFIISLGFIHHVFGMGLEKK